MSSNPNDRPREGDYLSDYPDYSESASGELRTPWGQSADGLRVDGGRIVKGNQPPCTPSGRPAGRSVLHAAARRPRLRFQ